MNSQATSQDSRGALPVHAGRTPRYRLDCPAKLNLFLEVGGKRADGYHEVVTVIAPIRLADSIYFSPRDDGQLVLSISYDGGMSELGMPPPSGNLVYRVLERFQKTAAVKLGAEIVLEKRIPLEAGLGGASSDAANALKLANLVWGVGWGKQRISEFAAGFGSDLPFFLCDGWAVCRGRGEKVLPLESGLQCPVVLVKPPIGFSTAEIYRRHLPPSQLQSPAAILDAIAAGRVNQLARNLFNRLELAAAGTGPWVERLQRLFGMLPVLGHQMTGSGSCYFGMFPNKAVALQSSKKLQAQLPECRVMVSELQSKGCSKIEVWRSELNDGACG